MANKFSFYKRIEALRGVFYESSENKFQLLNLINQAEVSEQVYDSNAIENSTLSLEETEKVLSEIDLDRFISQRELFETRNLARVIEYIGKKAIETPLDIETILLLHKMLLSNIRDEIAGRLRKEGEWVKVSNHLAPDPILVNDLLKKNVLEYNSSSLNIIQKISKFHLQFENTHPFVDGNGRLGRVIINYLLIREGYVPINIKYSNKSKYYEALREFYVNNKTDKMELIIGKALTNSYHKRITYLKAKNILTLSEYAKINNLSLSNLLNKANRQTISAFYERGVWKIGD